MHLDCRRCDFVFANVLLSSEPSGGLSNCIFIDHMWHMVKFFCLAWRLSASGTQKTSSMKLRRTGCCRRHQVISFNGAIGAISFVPCRIGLILKVRIQQRDFQNTKKTQGVSEFWGLWASWRWISLGSVVQFLRYSSNVE